MKSVAPAPVGLEVFRYGVGLTGELEDRKRRPVQIQTHRQRKRLQHLTERLLAEQTHDVIAADEKLGIILEQIGHVFERVDRPRLANSPEHLGVSRFDADLESQTPRNRASDREDRP